MINKVSPFSRLVCLFLSAAMFHLSDATARESEFHFIKTSNSQQFTDRFDAEVWLAVMSRRLKNRIRNPDERLNILNTIRTEANRVGLAAELVLAVIEIESSFNRWAISSVGARGLMQIMPFWVKELGSPNDNLFHLQTNIRLGCKILRHYIDVEKGDIAKGLARYNGSKGSNRYPKKIMSALRNNWWNP